MGNWSLELGIYPGILIGMRSYYAINLTEHVLYIPFIELILTTYK